MDELFLKIDVSVEAAIPWANRCITILLLKRGGGMPYGHPTLGSTAHYISFLDKLTAHTSLLEALRSLSIQKLLDLD